MRKGETLKPCPGCGEPGLRDANGVCFLCTVKLKEANEARERQVQDVEHRVYDAPATFPWYHAPNPYGQGREDLRALEQKLRALMKTLVHSIGVKATGTETYNPNRSKLFTFPKGYRLEYSYGDSHLLLKPETAQTLDLLDTTIQAALDAAYQAGKEDGSHLLFQLADGDITVSDFTNRITPNKP